MTPRRGLSTLTILAIVFGGFCLVSLAVGAFVNRDKTPASPPPTADPFDRAAFDAYWAGPGVTQPTRDLVKSVDWSGGVLTAHTQLVADQDAVTPATTICGALSGYWVLRGAFHSVRVVDGADQVLVSRHTAGDTCTWRR